MPSRPKQQPKPPLSPTIFGGFSSRKQKTIPLYAEFFSDLLPLIDDLAELKVLLFCFRALQQKEGVYRYMLRRDFLNDAALMQGLAVCNPQHAPENILDAALAKAIDRGALLCAEIMLANKAEVLYFMNTARGRTAIQQIQSGKWQPGLEALIEILPDRPNIYTLYEQNIGLLTPMIAEALKDAEKEFPVGWLEDALKLAVEHNKRSWRYMHAILDRWRTEGKRDHETTGRHTGESYLPGQYDDYLKS
jgi:DnaD/phage-associated family protein